MDKFANVLNNEIKPGEEILWRGQPEPDLFLKSRDWQKLLPRFIFLLFIIFLLKNYEGPDSLFNHHSIIYWAFFLVIIELFLRVTSLYGIKKRLYAITNECAIIISTSPILSIRRFSKAKLIDYTKTLNQDGSGSIIFTDGKFDFLWGKSGFLWLKDVKNASAALDKLVKEPA